MTLLAALPELASIDSQTIRIAIGALFGVLGLWMSVPRGSSRSGWFGAAIALAGLALFASALPAVAALGAAKPAGETLPAWAAQVTFWLIAAVTLAASLGTVASRDPVYCAVWFALSLVGTAGLLLLVGAQLLSLATITVYAGAIVVTFLFVLMLARPRGQAHYDRTGWSPGAAIVAPLVSMALVGTMAVGITQFAGPEGGMRFVETADAATGPTDGEANASAPAEVRPIARPGGVLAEHHVATFGSRLFGQHLIAVELAGTLLLVALVGAVAIVMHRPRRDGTHGRVPGPPNGRERV